MRGLRVCVLVALITVGLLSPPLAWARKGDFDLDIPLGMATLITEEETAVGAYFGLEGRLSLSDQLIPRITIAGQAFKDVGGFHANVVQGSLGALWVFPKADFFMEPYLSADFGATHLFGDAFSETRFTLFFGGGLTYYTRHHFFYGPRLQYDYLVAAHISEIVAGWAAGYRF